MANPAPKIFQVEVKPGRLVPITARAARYPFGGGVGYHLETEDPDFGPVWDVLGVNLAPQGAPDPGPGHIYVKSYDEKEKKYIRAYEAAGMIRVIDWNAFPMPFGKSAALAEVLIKDSELAK